MELSELIALQAKHQKEFGLEEDQLEAIRHSFEHLGKLTGKIATAIEPVRHSATLDAQLIEDEVIPDLLYWAIHLSAVLEVDLAKTYLARLEQDQTRIIEQGRRLNG